MHKHPTIRVHAARSGKRYIQIWHISRTSNFHVFAASPDSLWVVWKLEIRENCLACVSLNGRGIKYKNTNKTSPIHYYHFKRRNEANLSTTTSIWWLKREKNRKQQKSRIKWTTLKLPPKVNGKVSFWVDQKPELMPNIPLTAPSADESTLHDDVDVESSSHIEKSLRCSLYPVEQI